MKSIHYRVWDNENNKYFEPTYEALNGKLEDLHIGLKGDLFMRTLDGTTHCDSVFPGRFIIEKAAHKLDYKNQQIHVGDIVRVKTDHGYSITACSWNPETNFNLIDQDGTYYNHDLYYKPGRLEVIGNIHQVPIPTEPGVFFPLGVELTSLENGELIIAPEGTPPEEIVGTVTLNGLERK